MKNFLRIPALALSVALGFTACAGAASGAAGSADSAAEATPAPTASPTAETASAAAVTDADRLALLADYRQDNTALAFNNSAWQYDADNNVYYQIGVAYCTSPETTDYETLGIYVPGSYLTGTANGDGTYTCTVNAAGAAGGYTAANAPIVFPVNTPGYASQAAPTSYSYDGLADYLNAGMIYVYAGMRGRANGYDSNNALTYSAGAPWGVTDLKAAVRYIRYNAAALPGSTSNLFTFGMSGGGAQSALMGATGDSTLYFNYLTSIGAAMTDADGAYLSDAVSGSMCWCPITSLDYADEAYEWNMGQYMTADTRADGTFTKALSDDLAKAYAAYINQLGLTDADGNALTLTESTTGIYAAGSYYDYLLSVVNTSLNNFLSDTTFPYTPSNAFNASGNFGGGGTDASADAATSQIAAQAGSTGSAAGSGLPSGSLQDGGIPSGSRPEGMGGMGGMMGDSASTDTTTYNTVQEYIDSLNADGTWIQYDAASNTATVTSMADFITHCKTATKSVTAFDALDRSAGENDLFGNDESDSLHFDTVLAGLLAANKTAYAAYSDWNDSYVADTAADLTATDKLGTSLETRMAMYNPMYYLSGAYEGYGTSNVAAHWRIRTGIDQGDTALTVETNLALALQQYTGVSDVDFATVWGLKHTMAERTGDSTANFISWVADCVSA